MPAPDIIADDISGTYNQEWVFSHNQYQDFTYLRWQQPYPPNPNPTGLPLAVKQLTAIWHTLDDATKRTWTALAASLRIQRYAAYMSANLRLYFAGQPFTETPPP